MEHGGQISVSALQHWTYVGLLAFLAAYGIRVAFSSYQKQRAA
jgi:hypothetical protein